MGVRSRTSGIVGATLALAWVAGAAPAAAQDVPPAVASWFAQDAAAVAADVLGAGAVDAAGGTAPAGTYTVGEPVPLHHWDEAFVEGQDVEPVVFDDEWVAPLSRDGVVVGTIAAVESAGTVTFSYLDDDAGAGTVLDEGVEGDVLQDTQLGGLVEVVEGGQVEAVSEVADDFLATVADEGSLQEMVQEAHDPGIQTIRADGAAAASAGGVDVRSAAGLLLVAGGALALLRRRAAAAAR